MTTKRRMDYRVDEDALKRMMAGDVTALEETVPPAGALEKRPSLSGRRKIKRLLPVLLKSKRGNFRMK